MRESLLKDDHLSQIIESFESTHKDESFANWTGRGYLMSQGVLYRFVPNADTEEAQLVVPSHEVTNVLKQYHDAPTAGHYGEEGTYHRIEQRYYWSGMRSSMADYAKKCPECAKYKSSNLKPAGLLRTPVQSQRFETLSIDLFGPLPEGTSGKRWIFIVQDCATRWVKPYALKIATAHECATTLVQEVFLRYGIPRRLISDNGPQFISAVLQQVCFILKTEQCLTPIYRPQENRDLKPRLAILVGNENDSWEEKLPCIRFAMNTHECEITCCTLAFLQFASELRTIDDIVNDLTSVIENDNFVPEIRPYLKRFSELSSEIRDRIEKKQDQRKQQFGRRRRPLYFSPGDKVWVTTHPVSKAHSKITAKFVPKKDRPYLTLTQKSPTTYVVSRLDSPDEPLGTYHVSALHPVQSRDTQPVSPIKKRGRPIKTRTTSPPPGVRSSVKRHAPSRCAQQDSPSSSSGRRRNQRGDCNGDIQAYNNSTRLSVKNHLSDNAINWQRIGGCCPVSNASSACGEENRRIACARAEIASSKTRRPKCLLPYKILPPELVFGKLPSFRSVPSLHRHLPLRTPMELIKYTIIQTDRQSAR
ncbi:Protein NYNRIN [Araneus ventricosus]|uniref:RNA-directed DNA polymerase n=1 Tax=Araneus ventricosus TaxID=182803 RepID=A0A4Y2GZ36_ARAVE|nr:Protein NYNRIN [Araneus ventricosus]